MAATDSNAITLAGHAQLSNSDVIGPIVQAIYDTDNVLKDIPLTRSDQFKVINPRLEADGLPTVAWGRVSKEADTTKAEFKQHEEAASLVRSRIRMDRRILKQKNWITDPIKAQVMAWTQAWSYEANDKFFNNDPSAVGGNVDAWVGLKARLDNPVKYGLVPEMKIDSGGLNLKPNMTKADANNFLELIDQILSYLGASDGNGVIFYCNDVLYRRWASAIRTAGEAAGFKSTTDAYDREVATHRGAKIRDAGRNRDQVTRIISNSEGQDGNDPGNGDRTSLYAVRYGEGRFTGWHDGDLEPEHTGVLDDGVTHQWLIDYLIGLNPTHNRCIARAYNIEIS